MRTRSDMPVGLAIPGPHWEALLQQNPANSATLQQMAEALLSAGHTLAAQQALELCVSHVGDTAAILSLMNFWTVLGYPRSARSYLSTVAEKDLQPNLCLRISRSYADEQDWEGARHWWVQAYKILSVKTPIGGKRLLNWMGAYRPIYGTSVFRELDISKREAGLLIRLSRHYSDGSEAQFKKTVREFYDHADARLPDKYDLRIFLGSRGEAHDSASLLKAEHSTADHTLALIRPMGGWAKAFDSGCDNVQLHFSMSLKIGGTEWRMLRSLVDQNSELRQIIITCDYYESTDNPVMTAMADASGIEVHSIVEFLDNPVTLDRRIELLAIQAPDKEILNKHLNLGLISACINALQHFSPSKVTVWGMYVFEHAAFAAYLSDRPEVILMAGSLPLQAHPGSSIQARSRQLFVARSCAMFMADPRFKMIINTRSIWRDFQKKVPMPLAERGVSIKYNPFPVDLVDSISAITPAQIKSKIGLPEGDLVVGHVTRIDANKNLRLWLETAAELARVMQHVSFVIVGEGQAKDFAKDFARQLGIATKCYFVGRQVTNLKAYYQLMDVLLLTSYSEGLPNTLIEAQALGIPVVARATGGVVEAVWHEKTGLVIQSSSPQVLAEAVRRVLNEPFFKERTSVYGPAFIRALGDSPAIALEAADSLFEALRRETQVEAGHLPLFF